MKTLVRFESHSARGLYEYINPDNVFSIRAHTTREYGEDSEFQPICIMSAPGTTVWVVGRLREVADKLGFEIRP